MDSRKKSSQIRAFLTKLRKVVDRRPEVPLTPDQLKKLKKQRMMDYQLKELLNILILMQWLQFL